MASNLDLKPETQSAASTTKNASIFDFVKCVLSRVNIFSSNATRDKNCCCRCLLSKAPCKKLFRIVEVVSGRHGRKRLADLGLVETALISVISSSRLGMVLTLPSGGRLAIDRNLAEEVLVESL